MVPEPPGGDYCRMETETSPTPRRIKRSRDDRMLGGVCGGIARHFDIDPVIVRIATVTLVCAVGVGAVAYLAETANHHPDVTINWNKVTLTLSTHSAGGLTANDFALARQIDALS